MHLANNEGYFFGGLRTTLTRFRRRRIGLVFQAFNLVPTLTAEENILLPVYTDGRTDLVGAVEPLLERLGIAGRRKHRPDALSGGVVTHEPSVAIWAERVLVMKDGQLISDFPTADFGTAEKLAAHYHHVVGTK